jgi:hypothetical protein
MEETKYYILFPSHTEGMKLETLLKSSHIKYTIVPTPRELSSCCGISIMYNPKDKEAIDGIIEDNAINISGKHSITKKIKNYYLD